MATRKTRRVNPLNTIKVQRRRMLSTNTFPLYHKQMFTQSYIQHAHLQYLLYKIDDPTLGGGVMYAHCVTFVGFNVFK